MPVTLTGPSPHDLTGHPHPLGFCAVCAAAWKAAAFEDQSGDVTAADASPEPVTIVLHARGLPTPAPAVAYGLVMLPAPPGSPATGQPVMVPLPLCWTHVQAVSFTGSGLLIANNLPPGGVRLDRPH